MPILASMVLLVLSFLTAPWRVEADEAGEAPLCEGRLRGQSYECIAATSDPLGICYRNCFTVLDAADGFVLEQQDLFGRDPTILQCSCAGDGDALPGERWFRCTGDDFSSVMTGKVTRAGRRIRRGFTDYVSGGFYDVFSCIRSTSCVPTFSACSALPMP